MLNFIIKHLDYFNCFIRFVIYNTKIVGIFLRCRCITTVKMSRKYIVNYHTINTVNKINVYKYLTFKRQRKNVPTTTKKYPDYFYYFQKV
jgi:hypothetical protein